MPFAFRITKFAPIFFADEVNSSNMFALCYSLTYEYSIIARRQQLVPVAS
jgi:hypothetical protein